MFFMSITDHHDPSIRLVDYYLTHMSNMSVISWREQVTFDEKMIWSALYLNNPLSCIFNSAKSLKRQSASRQPFRLLLLLNTMYSSEQQQIPISYDVVWANGCSNPWFTASHYPTDAIDWQNEKYLLWADVRIRIWNLKLNFNI